MKFWTWKKSDRERFFAWYPVHIPAQDGGYWIWWEHYYERNNGYGVDVWQ